MVKQNEELTSRVTVTQNTSRVLLEAGKTTNSNLKELGRQYQKLEQYSRRECLDLSGIPSSVPSKDLENFALHVLQEIGVDHQEVMDCHLS